MSLKNLTITLDAATAGWVKQAAAQQGKSMSRFISDVLQQHLPQARAYEAAMNRWMARKPWRLTEPGERLPTRDELYDRPVLRRR